MPSELILLFVNKLEKCDVNVLKISEFFGIKVRPISAYDSLNDSGFLKKEACDRDLCVATSSKTLADGILAEGVDSKVRNLIFSAVRYMFVYDTESGGPDSAAISRLTDGYIVQSEKSIDARSNYEISDKCQGICAELSGLTFGPANRNCDFTFKVKDDSFAFDNIITIESEPFFFRLRKARCTLFWLGVKELVDIRSRIDRDFSFRTLFSKSFPFIMFLRYVFGDKCWHASGSQACLIIDDPLIKERYGYLNYDLLLKLSAERSFSASVAFIPFNYKRTDQKVSRKLQEKEDRFSLCIHGCDHTKMEFGTVSCRNLSWKAKLALERMEKHKKSTGLRYDRVMVFPQGIFSTNSMSVLKSNNYLAAVNTSPFSCDVHLPLRTCDFLSPGIMTYNHFPLFLRRPPGDIIDFVFDLFLKKPVLVVLHHDYFRDGYESLGKLIGAINGCKDDIKWTSLEKIVRKSYWQRKVSDDTICVQLYARRASIKNDSGRELKYVICWAESKKIRIADIYLNGKSVAYEIGEGQLRVSTLVKAGEELDFEIVYEDDYRTCGAVKDGKFSVVRPFVRRRLCEFRDNIISKKPFMLELSDKIKKLVS
jgi:hypothetical protein